MAQIASSQQPYKDTGTHTAVPFPILRPPQLSLHRKGQAVLTGTTAQQSERKHHAEIK